MAIKQKRLQTFNHIQQQPIYPRPHIKFKYKFTSIWNSRFFSSSSSSSSFFKLSIGWKFFDTTRYAMGSDVHRFNVFHFLLIILVVSLLILIFGLSLTLECVINSTKFSFLDIFPFRPCPCPRVMISVNMNRCKHVWNVAVHSRPEVVC